MARRRRQTGFSRKIRSRSRKGHRRNRRQVAREQAAVGALIFAQSAVAGRRLHRQPRTVIADGQTVAIDQVPSGTGRQPSVDHRETCPGIVGAGDDEFPPIVIGASSLIAGAKNAVSRPAGCGATAKPKAERAAFCQAPGKGPPGVVFLCLQPGRQEPRLALVSRRPRPILSVRHAQSRLARPARRPNNH